MSDEYSDGWDDKSHIMVCANGRKPADGKPMGRNNSERKSSSLLS